VTVEGEFAVIGEASLFVEFYAEFVENVLHYFGGLVCRFSCPGTGKNGGMLVICCCRNSLDELS
jgi:hypothetical protein